jgi:glyoxylase I family protein
MAIQSVSHLGICVSDLERSTRFYSDVLGFREQFTMEMGDEVAATMEQADHPDGIRFTSRSLARPDLRIELLHWQQPAAEGDGQRRPMTGLGLTHLCLRVDDVDDLRDAAVAAGGGFHQETLSVLPGMGVDGADVRLVYLTDPDGVRIECMSGTPDFALPRD